MSLTPIQSVKIQCEKIEVEKTLQLFSTFTIQTLIKKKSIGADTKRGLVISQI